MAIMEKTVLLGVRKEKMPNKPYQMISKMKKKKKNFMRKIVDYLRSDSYLFAPLASSTNNLGSLKGIEIREKVKEASKKKLAKKVGEYLMSDTYMYSPLLVAPPKSFSIVPKETQPIIKSVTTVEFSSKSISLKDIKQSANEITKVRKSEDNLSGKFMMNEPRSRSLFHEDTMKRAIYQTVGRQSQVSFFGS